MNKISLLENMAMIAIFITLLLSFFLFTIKSSNKLSNRLFGIFLITMAIDLSGFFIFKYTKNYLNIETLRITTFLLTMPIFYFYVLSLCYNDFKLKQIHFLHFIPYVILNVVLLPRVYLANSIEKISFFENMSEMPEMHFCQILGEVQVLVYFVLVFLVLKKFKKIYLENYTNLITTYKWLFQMTVIFVIAHSFVIVRDILKHTNYSISYTWINIVIGINVLFITCWFVLKALKNPELFRGIDSKIPLTEDLVKELKIENTIDESKHNEIEFLKNFMLEKEPFLDPSLTIQDLANQIKIPARDLSILINHQMKQHFFDFINEYRIKKAMNILKDASKNNLTILEVLYQVGFNSKSSFNTSFKKQTGQTPTDFRNNSI
ncbi:AraC family transcriptional regulator [Flavobacterium sp.]|uniref:helix-turn-helix domain-containing protein n=1 Tax=Flavobacterium sp. TaxID=239 RepID=UPI00286EA0FB|nr:AraC family transcriptional regulator [Flavobacterium sp.]